MEAIAPRLEQGVLILSLLKGFMEDVGLKDFPGSYKPALARERRLILDLSDLDYIDSSHLAALVVCYKRVVEAGGRVVFCGLKPSVRETFLITRLDRVFVIATTRREAIELALSTEAAGPKPA
jgi:anti-anti-sigma factor